MLLTVECNYHFFLHLVTLEKTFETFCQAWVCAFSERNTIVKNDYLLYIENGHPTLLS